MTRYKVSDDEKTIIDTALDEELDLDEVAERLNAHHDDVQNLQWMLLERNLES